MKRWTITFEVARTEQVEVFADTADEAVAEYQAGNYENHTPLDTQYETVLKVAESDA